MTWVDVALDGRVLGWLVLAAAVVGVLYCDWCQYRYDAHRVRMRQEDVEE